MEMNMGWTYILKRIKKCIYNFGGGTSGEVPTWKSEKEN
jgi:hypothetical protein